MNTPRPQLTCSWRLGEITHLTPCGLNKLDWMHNSEDWKRSNLEASQQARLPLDYGTEFTFVPTRRAQGSPWPSSHKRTSSESASSCTLFNHSWISSSESFQKETRRTSGSRLQGTNSSHFSSLVRVCALSNTGLHVSLSQSNV